MSVRGVKTRKDSKVKYTGSIIISLLLAVILFSPGCQFRKKTITDGLGNAYVSSAQMVTDYSAAQQKAYEDSLPALAVLFKAGAVMEQVHIQKIKEYYADYTGEKNGLSEYDTLKNVRKFDTGTSAVFLFDSTEHSLAYFIGKQSYMVNSLFESLATQAETEHDPELAKWYIWFLDSETSAYRIFSDAYKNFGQSHLFTDKYNVCSRCGSIYIYGDNVQYCTVCGEKADKFILVQ